MFEYISGLVLKNKIFLAPIYNPTHQVILRNLNIEDNLFNASKKFVKMRLTSPNGDKRIPVEQWNIIIPQDIVPDWYSADTKRYQDEFRILASERARNFIAVIANKVWTPIKTDDIGIYYLLDGALKNNQFSSKSNDYTSSDIRKNLQISELLRELKSIYGDRLAPINLSLTSMDGIKDYRSISDDLLAIPNLDLYRECKENIPPIGDAYWLSTADSTPNGLGSTFVRYVRSQGLVDRCEFYQEKGIRPFFILKHGE